MFTQHSTSVCNSEKSKNDYKRLRCLENVGIPNNISCCVTRYPQGANCNRAAGTTHYAPFYHLHFNRCSVLGGVGELLQLLSCW